MQSYLGIEHSSDGINFEPVIASWMLKLNVSSDGNGTYNLYDDGKFMGDGSYLPMSLGIAADIFYYHNNEDFTYPPIIHTKRFVRFKFFSNWLESTAYWNITLSP